MKIKFDRIHSLAEYGLPDFKVSFWVDTKDINSFQQSKDKILTIYDNDGNYFDTDTYTGDELAEKLDKIEKLNID